MGFRLRRSCSPGAVNRGTAVIPKSVNPERMKSNLEAAELTLAQTDIEAIDSLDIGRRYVSGEFWAMPGSPYTVDWLWNK